MIPQALAMGMACRLYGITPLELVAHRREPNLIQARALAIWAMRQDGAHSYPAIGRTLERDHSSIINLHRKAERLRQSDPAFRRNCASVIDRHHELKGMDHASR